MESHWLNIGIATIILFAILTISIYLLQQWLFRDKRKVYIGKWIADVFTVIEVRKVTPFTKSILIKRGKTELQIPFDVSKPSFRSRKSWIYCVDIDSAQVGFARNDFNVPSELYDMIFAKGSIKHIISGINKPQIAGFILYIMVGIAIGLPTGLLIGMRFL